MSGNYDGEFSRRVAEAAATFAREKESRDCEQEEAKLKEHIAIAEKALLIAGANALHSRTFMSAIKIMADTQVWSLRLQYGTLEQPKRTKLVQLSPCHWALEDYTGTWEPSKGPLDEWCIKVLSGQIEEEIDGIPF